MQNPNVTPFEPKLAHFLGQNMPVELQQILAKNGFSFLVLNLVGITQMQLMKFISGLNLSDQHVVTLKNLGGDSQMISIGGFDMYRLGGPINVDGKIVNNYQIVIATKVKNLIDDGTEYAEQTLFELESGLITDTVIKHLTSIFGDIDTALTAFQSLEQPAIGGYYVEYVTDEDTDIELYTDIDTGFTYTVKTVSLEGVGATTTKVNTGGLVTTTDTDN